MISRIHVNQQLIKHNLATGSKIPVISVMTYQGTKRATVVRIDGPCHVVYDPDNPLSCGAKVWIETTSNVEVIR